MRIPLPSTTTICLLFVWVVSQRRAYAQTENVQNDQRAFQNGLIEQTGRLIRSANKATFPTTDNSPLVLRGLQTQDTSALTTVLEDGTTVISIQPICRALEQNFAQNVTCTCTGSSLSFFSITCHYAEAVCSLSGTTCGKPVLALSIINYEAFSATTCVYNYTRNDVALPDVCISLQTCPTATSDAGVQQQSFCSCIAQVNGGVCSECSLCQLDGDGLVMDSSPLSATITGLFLNCSNQNAEFVSDTCSALDIDLDVSGMSSAMSGFIPNFKGFCSQLESGMDNKIECDCSDSGGGNFNVTCATVDEECYQDKNETVCGKVESLVMVEQGLISNVTACSDYSKPYDLERTCVSFALEQNEDKQDRIVDCEASYAGQRCSCDLCNDGEGVSIDCSNSAPWARTESCQPIRNVYEFLPAFPDPPMSSATRLMIASLPTLLIACFMLPSLF